MFVAARVDDSTMNVADKFAILWNIDVENFSVGMFLNQYGNNLNTTGKMKVDNGHMDMWYWDASVVAPNGTGQSV